MKTTEKISKATKFTLTIVNVCCRVILFYFYWLATNDIFTIFENRQFAFINQMWAWQQKPYQNISIISADQCPDEQYLLTKFQFPGIKQHYDSNFNLIPSQPSEIFEKWTTQQYQQSFILCGFQIDLDFTQTAISNQSCDDRQLKNCGTNDTYFCVNTNQSCPINSFQFNMNNNILEIITTNLDTLQDQLPISLFRIDSYIPCLTNNNTNAMPNIQYDQYFEEIPSSCLEYDTDYIQINNITDTLYFEINNASNIYIEQNSTKQFYYKPYPFWNKTCNGELFNEIYTLQSYLNSYKQIQKADFYIVVIYLLICNYIIPMIPYILRCISSLNNNCILFIDYVLRITFTILMTYLSFISINYGDAIIESQEKLWGNYCIQNEDEIYGNFNDALDLQNALNIVAITFSFIMWSIEGTILWFWACHSTVKRCIRKYKRKQNEHQFQQLNQSSFVQ